MVIFIIRNYVQFGGKHLEVFVSWCESKCANIAAVQGDGSNKRVLPCEQNVVVLGDAGVAVITPLLLGHGLLHPVLWRE